MFIMFRNFESILFEDEYNIYFFLQAKERYYCQIIM